MENLELQNGDRFTGEIMNDLKEGQGIYEFQNGDRYEGTYQDNQ